MSVDDIPINLSIATAHELAALMEQGRLTSTQLETACLARIELADPMLGAFTEGFADAIMCAFARHLALSAVYASPGWLPAVRFIPCEAYTADKAWTGHSRLESANLCATRLTAPVRLRLSYCS